MKIGAIVESFRLGLDGGLKAAAGLKVDGVQIYAVRGEMRPGALSSKQRADLLKRIGGLGLEVSALCGDLGGHGFQQEDENRGKIEETKRIIDLALDLGCRVVTTHIGVIPSDPAHPRYSVMARACETMGRYAGSRGATLAIETGPEPAAVLRGFIDRVGAGPGLGVNFDPANLVMVCRENIPEAVRSLAGSIVHTHAKDGVNLKPVDPEKLYGSFAGDEIPGFNWRDYISETPLGRGKVPFAAYLDALRASGYDGYLTIEREVGSNPAADISEAVGFLRALLK